jgi:hypothetical protein
VVNAAEDAALAPRDEEKEVVTMLLTSEQIKGIAEFSDGDDCTVAKSKKGLMGGELTSYVTVTRKDYRDRTNKDRVRIFENGQTERVTDPIGPYTEKANPHNG